MDSDEELLSRVGTGNMAAFDELYGRYEERLFSFLMGVLANREEAEEVFHDALMQTLRRAQMSFTPGGVRLWLYRVAHNLALNRLRSRARQRRGVADLEQTESPTPRADQALEQAELDEAVGMAIEKLPDRLKEVYHLRTSGLSYEEMAEVLEVPLGTLKSRMHQMVDHLRQEMKPWIVR